jgi:hypothetical protein
MCDKLKMFFNLLAKTNFNFPRIPRSNVLAFMKRGNEANKTRRLFLLKLTNVCSIDPFNVYVFRQAKVFNLKGFQENI